MRALFVGTSISLLLAGCASVPPVTMSYYPPAASTEVKVIQTIGCNTAKTDFVIGYAVTATTSYFRRPNVDPHTFKLATLGSRWADASGTFIFTEDGRLRSINTSSTGQGEAIIKAGAAMVTAVVGLGIVSPCDAVTAAGKDGVVSLVYTARIDPTLNPSTQVSLLGLNAADTAIRERIGSTLPVPELVIGAGERNAPPISLPDNAPAGDVVMLTLNHTLTRTMTVREPGRASPLWTSTVVAPETATYQLPIPRAALFGTRTFGLVLADSGQPTSGGYSATSGAAGFLNTVGTVATALTDDSVAAQAADTKAEADLIAQQQRLVRCRANPSACT
jgi:hypothetical protein